MPGDDDTTLQLRELLAQNMKTTNELIASLPNMLTTTLAGVGQAQAQAAAPAAQAAANPPAGLTVPHNLRDRKVPDFWDTAPRAWFRILDDHLALANPPLAEDAKFSLLLPLLQGKAVTKILRLVESPPADAYSQAKALLVQHFERSSEEMIAELHGFSSLGDMTAVDFLEHMRSLQPGEPESKLFRHIFVHALPAHVRSIVSGKEQLQEMAAAADVILRAVPSPTIVLAICSSATTSSSVAVGHIPRDQLRTAYASSTCGMARMLITALAQTPAR